jgi:hypothetical protein
MSALLATVANCFMGGDEITKRGNRSARDIVNFRCGGYVFRFRQNAVALSPSFSDSCGDLVDTSEVLVEGVSPTSLATVRRILDSICWLLSLAGLSRVVSYRYEYPQGSGLGGDQSVVAQSSYFRPTIEIRDGAAVRTFVEQTYPKFRTLQRRRKLPVVIDYLVLAERVAQPMEVRLVLLFVALECLKTTYAKSHGMPFIAGRYHQPSSKPSKLGRVCGFEDLLKLMLTEVGMRRGLRRIVQLRNDIVHSGVSRRSYTQQLSTYERAHDVVREYLLRLLGYHGTYLTYSSAGSRCVEV